MTLTASQPQEKFRKDYHPSDFAISSVDLHFDLEANATTVHSKIQFVGQGANNNGLRLDGEGLETISISIDGRQLGVEEYAIEDDTLILANVPDSFIFEASVKINPLANTQLSGLYQTSGNYCTQCEAEGFRRITWFLDRPDVMTTYSVRIEGDKSKCPIMLSNGNLIESGDLDGGRHFTVWQDPFKKPSYLFALVAGDLGSIQGSFTTMSGRNVDLYLYTEHENVDKLDYAMTCLQASMKWDEDKFGREYDLDIYNIVAVGDFNMGAMENKSLNVFNTAYVLARPDTATDSDYEHIDGVIAHEYFHNWTGNRVTCQDWFQLTLKEGLTVFRDQLYSADRTSVAVKRNEDVKALRSFQFPEDAGPMSHPIRPDSYIAMDNFYTSTVYSKGAEVIGMYHTLLGADGFRKGMELYFERHDGQAVTCDDFRAAMSDANEFDLEQFENWYLQSGTPVLEMNSKWDDTSKTYRLHFRQSCPDTPGQTNKAPFHIPIRVCLLSAIDGRELIAETVLELTETEQSFEFSALSEEPVPSVLRGFSAPVRLSYDWTDEQLACLMGHDKDAFTRWEAGQTLFARQILNLVDDQVNNRPMELSPRVLSAFKQSLATDIDCSLKAYSLSLPDESTLAQEMDQVLPDELRAARKFLIKSLAESCNNELASLYSELAPNGPFAHNTAEAGRRRLRNLCMGYLASQENDEAILRCQTQMQDADNMTDEFAAFACLVGMESDASIAATDNFYEKWKTEDLVVDKWLAAQAGASRADTCELVEQVRNHEAFSISNPNKVRSLVRVFFRNLSAFHRGDGFGYKWVADRVIELNALNPQVAARMAGAFGAWRRFDEARQALMKEQLERILNTDNVCKDVYEIVSKTLDS